MNVGHCDTAGLGHPLDPVVPAAVNPPLHRLATARKLQGISHRVMARRLNIDIAQLREQESETSDIRLSVLYAWQKVLQVPVAELLAETGDSLASPVLQRSQLVRLMKTVMAIGDQTKQTSIHRMAQTMMEQLIEIMPELANVSPWHAIGKRRGLNELGVAAQRRLSDDVFIEEDD